ncbi:MAG: hypothetical protein VX836_02470 [Pseudomonadota bacterium]|jgi:hypothetical protein|nr:hypothetical protein [Pseudomonadota bacterium]
MNARISTHRAMILAALLMAGTVHARPEGKDSSQSQAAEPTLGPAAGLGATIVGDQDAALGLFIVPWKEERPDDLDHPPRIIVSTPTAISADSFERDADYEDGRTAYRRARLERTR